MKQTQFYEDIDKAVELLQAALHKMDCEYEIKMLQSKVSDYNFKEKSKYIADIKYLHKILGMIEELGK
jgi:hypothetical protein